MPSSSGSATRHPQPSARCVPRGSAVRIPLPPPGSGPDRATSAAREIPSRSALLVVDYPAAAAGRASRLGRHPAQQLEPIRRSTLPPWWDRRASPEAGGALERQPAMLVLPREHLPPARSGVPHPPLHSARIDELPDSHTGSPLGKHDSSRSARREVMAGRTGVMLRQLVILALEAAGAAGVSGDHLRAQPPAWLPLS
jgi:hypothetical protein